MVFAAAAASSRALRPVPRRTLGDKLQQLAKLAPDKVQAIERLVDFLLACVVISQTGG